MKNKTQNTKVSQLDKANAALRGLAHDVTTEDRAKAPLSQPMVVAYLKGEGKDLGTAMDLLRYFRKRIADREKELEARA